MTIFTVHVPPRNGTADASEHARFVAESGSRLALVLPPVFLIQHRLWYALAVYCLAAAAAFGIAVLGYPAAATVLIALAGLFLFLEGNELARRALEEKGWRLAAIVAAQDRDEAELRYFAGVAPDAPEAIPARHFMPSPAGGDDRPSIGIFSK